MKTMMAVTAGLLLLAGQATAATGDIVAPTAPTAHARAANICVAPQKANARVSQVRGRVANRCQTETVGGIPLLGVAAVVVIAGAAIYGEAKNHQFPSSP